MENLSGKLPTFWDFLSGPVVKNLPSNTEDSGLISGWGTKIPHATGQPSWHVPTTELHMPQWRAPVPQLNEYIKNIKKKFKVQRSYFKIATSYVNPGANKYKTKYQSQQKC